MMTTPSRAPAVASWPPAWAALVWDMAASGITHELASTPFPYFQAAQPVPQISVPPAAVAQSKLASEVGAAITPKAPATPIASVRVWSGGEPGGVVVVVAGETPPHGPAAQLLANMLKAVGLAGRPVGFVGAAGTPATLAAPGVGSQLVEQLQKLAPQQVLVLGQGALGAWLGQPCSPTIWHENPQPLPEWSGQVGVTYALEHLLKYPTHKRAAWAHLRRWQAHQGESND
jgi:hypothetical protein